MSKRQIFFEIFYNAFHVFRMMLGIRKIQHQSKSLIDHLLGAP
jgi:hypothetical protein